MSRIKELYVESSIRPTDDDVELIQNQVPRFLPEVRDDITFRTNPVQHDDDTIRGIVLDALSV